MIWAAGIKNIYIAQHAIDFRKGPNGLISECYAMDLDPYRGDCILFLHRSRRSVKVICGDAHGVWVLLRRFEGGALGKSFPFLADRSCVSATAGELAMLLEGATCVVKTKAKPWKTAKEGDSASQAVLTSGAYDKKDVGKKTTKLPDQGASGGLCEDSAVG